MSSVRLALSNYGRNKDTAASASLLYREEQVDVFLHACSVGGSEGLDPFVGTGLLTAMHMGVPLSLANPISPRLLDSLDTIQDIYSIWYPAQMKRIPITAPATAPVPAPPGRGVGCFFS